MKKNKRGLSSVVATALMIMITIAAIAIIAGVVVPFVRDSLQRSSECTDYKGFYVFDESFGYNCQDEAQNFYAMSIKASFDKDLAENVAGMKIVFVKQDGQTRVVEVNNSQGTGNIWLAGARDSPIKLPSPGGITTYTYQAQPNEKFLSAEVYPVLRSDRICADIKESINIRLCDKPIS
jgi:flagellin-like protein